MVHTPDPHKEGADAGKVEKPKSADVPSRPFDETKAGVREALEGPTNTVEKLLEHLAYAFGGHSQYSTEHIGQAIAGQINNNGWANTPETYAREAASILYDRWEGQGNTEEEDEAEIKAAIEAALAKLNKPRKYSKEY